MAGSWGESFGASFGLSFGGDGSYVPPVEDTFDGHSAKYVAAVLAKRKKRREAEQERRIKALPPVMRPAPVATPVVAEPKTVPIAGLDSLARASSALDAAEQEISSLLRQALEDDEEAAVLLLLH